MFSISTLLLFLLVLSVLVFVHELGHFWTARRSGMRVDEFGFGFPPRLFGIKRGETLYSINAIPLGGFVRIHGESGQDRDDERSFAHASIPKRLVVLVAGVAMNLLLAAALLSFGFMVGLPTSVDGPLPKGATVRDEVVRISSIAPGSPAEEAGIASGDVLVGLDAMPVNSSDAARAYIQEHGDEGVHITLQRKQEQLEVDVVSADLPDFQVRGVGIGLIETATISYPIWRAIPEGIRATAASTWGVIRAFYDLLHQLVVERSVSSEISGPVGIAVLTGEAASLGFAYLLYFAAILSINLAVLNLLPIPALDGGRIVFVLIEAVRRKPNDAKVESTVHGIGFLCLMALVVLVTYRDIVHFGGGILGALRSFVGI